MPLTRRSFVAAAGLASPALSAAQSAATPVSPISPVSSSDLHYSTPVPRSEEGIPIGNGCMGTLVWTTPYSLRMQINRADVYPISSNGHSFFERHNDYCGGCAFVEISFPETAAPPFPESGFPQHLSVYDGRLTIQGRGVTVRAVAAPDTGLMAFEIAATLPVTVSLRALRYSSQYFGAQLEPYARDHVTAVRNRNHLAQSRLITQNGRIALTQDFREGEHACQSAVAAAIVRHQGTTLIPNETEVNLTAASPATILISSAATFDGKADIAAAAFRILDAAPSYAALARATEDWWHAFWSRGSLRLNAPEAVQQGYHYYLYIMAASSRGKYPPKFNGMLWNTAGDLRTWGAQHWFANLSCYYEALPATGRLELMDPALDMYSGMYDACAAAARQQWGSEGIYIPETVYFNGLAKLPDGIAAEMRELYLLRKPWAERSAAFMSYAETGHPHSSRWNWIGAGDYKDGHYVITERGFGPFGAVSHIMGATAKVAYLYWRRYEFTLDHAWLRDRAYPMLRGAAEFYRHFPNVARGSDGLYHIHNTNSNESVYGCTDSDEDVSSMRGIFAALIRASEILEMDADLRPQWREFLEHLAPLPTSTHPEALKPATYSGPPVFVRGLKPAVQGRGFLPDGNSLPMWFFDLCNPGSPDLAAANTTFDAYFRNGITAETPVSVLSKIAIAAATLGRADAVRHLVPNQIRVLTPERNTAYKNGAVLANRMTLREGPQALDAQRLGRASEALNHALLESGPSVPAGEPVIRVFHAWPKDWDATFTLLARGNFLVTSQMEKGRILHVELESRAGASCRIQNPWTGDARLERNGRPAERLSGPELRFNTSKGDRLRLTPA